MRTPPTLALTVAVVVAAAAGCGFNTGQTAPTTTTPRALAPPSTASPLPGVGSSAAAAAVPAVAHGGDLAVEPVPAPGRGAPPVAVVFRDLVVGHGASPPPGSTVTVRYVGALYTTGRVFTASWPGGPATFSLRSYLPGFAEAVTGMRVGGRREVVIPPSLGYGHTGHPPVVPPDATLVAFR